jgi:hypothetical protein
MNYLFVKKLNLFTFTKNQSDRRPGSIVSELIVRLAFAVAHRVVVAGCRCSCSCCRSGAAVMAPGRGSSDQVKTLAGSKEASAARLRAPATRWGLRCRRSYLAKAVRSRREARRICVTRTDFSIHSLLIVGST